MLTDDPLIIPGIDIWSWAMTSLEILTDVPAFGEKTKGPRIISNVASGKWPIRGDHPKLEQYAYANALWRLFEECWDQDAAARPTAGVIVQRLTPMLHEFMTDPGWLPTAPYRSLPTSMRTRGRINQAVQRAPQLRELSTQESAQLRELAQTASLTAAMFALSLFLPGPRSEPKATSISSRMSTAEIVKCLVDHGCEDVTSELDLSNCTEYPVAGGGYGDVYRGRLHDGLTVAIKCSRMFEEDICDTKEGRRKVMKAAHEMYVASKLEHSNIVGVTGVAHFKNRVAMVLPWMDNGVITTYLARTPDADRCAACTQVSKGLAYMHQKGIVHGDIKGVGRPILLQFPANQKKWANILVSEDGVAKITDFGNTILEQYTLQFSASQRTQGISARWTARELLTGEQVVATCPADVYALGMTILEIITGNVPFHDRGENAVLLAIIQQNLPVQPQDTIPSDSQDGDRLWQLITRCWAEQPTERPNAAEVEEIMGTITSERLMSEQQAVVVEQNETGETSQGEVG
ncbi:hypothetical protein FRC07_000737 [Ceratobasidium sp. 392]|nr:hypothetical protein FRC07_000737 [Ceratobasidium sp. 392]